MAFKPNYEDYEDDYDYLVACECYGLEMEYEEEARMAEELEDSKKESNNSSIEIILNEFRDYWTQTYVGLDFNSYTYGEVKCDVVSINDSQILVVCKNEQLDEVQSLLENLIRDYELSDKLSLQITKDYDKLLFDYERAIIIEDITE